MSGLRKAHGLIAKYNCLHCIHGSEFVGIFHPVPATNNNNKSNNPKAAENFSTNIPNTIVECIENFFLSFFPVDRVRKKKTKQEM